MMFLSKLFTLFSAWGADASNSEHLERKSVHHAHKDISTADTDRRQLGYWFGYDTIEDFVIKNSRTQVLEDLILLAGLGGVLDGSSFFDPPTYYTLFAPFNLAFERLEDTYPGITDIVTNENNTAILQQILTYHILDVEVLPADIPEEGVVVTTLAGEDLLAYKVCYWYGWWCYVGLEDGSGEVTWVTGFNRFATNGVTHMINKVLIPPSLVPTVEPLRVT